MDDLNLSFNGHMHGLRECKFIDCNPPNKVDIYSNDEIAANFVERKYIDADVQCSRDMSSHQVNTELRQTKSTGMNHTEGGWPEDVNTEENEQIARYLKRIEKDEMFTRTVQRLGRTMEHYIMQNNTIDIYGNYFESTDNEVMERPIEANVISVFRNSTQSVPVSHISWCPDKRSYLAVTYSKHERLLWDPYLLKNSFVWNIENPNEPDTILNSDSQVVCLEYNPKDSNIIAGGCISGQVGFWDSRKGSSFVNTSFASDDNCSSIKKLRWVNSKTASEFLSSSTDGQVMWWDVRKLNEPTSQLSLLDNFTDQGLEFGGCTCLEYEASLPMKFMVGLENGNVILCSKKSKSSCEGSFNRISAHLGSVFSIQRNPSSPKYFLTVGDWSTKIWSEDYLGSPIISLSTQESYVSDGCWSPTRSPLLFTANTMGSLQTWNLLVKHDKPMYSLQVCDEPLTCVQVQQQGDLIACGSQTGLTYLVHLSSELSNPLKGEKLQLLQLLEQESYKEKHLDSKKGEVLSKETEENALIGKDFNTELTSEDDDLLKKAEADFWNFVNSSQEVIKETVNESLIPDGITNLNIKDSNTKIQIQISNSETNDS